MKSSQENCRYLVRFMPEFVAAQASVPPQSPRPFFSTATLYCEIPDTKSHWTLEIGLQKSRLRET